MCHVSELSDDHIRNIETKYKAGERVAAKILKVNVFFYENTCLLFEFFSDFLEKKISCVIGVFISIVLS